MNFDNKDNLRLLDHLNKCRCCFEKFNYNENQIKITDIIKEQFLELTQIELKSSPSYSKSVCLKCKNELKSISSFRLDLITKQEQLYDFVTTSEYQNQDMIEFESVNIKIESQSSDEFDFASQYDEVEGPESPESPVTIETRDYESPIKRYSLRNQKTLEPKLQTKLEETQDEKQQKCFKFFCDWCGHGTKTKKGLESHLKSHLRKMFLKSKVEKKPNGNSKFMCPHCGKFLSTSGSLSNHIQRHHIKQKLLFCDLCGYGAFVKNDLTTHMETHVPLIYREKFNCDQCEYVSLSKTRLRQHKKFGHATEVMLFVCHCGKSFDKPSNFRYHTDYHHRKYEKVNKNICTICGKLFLGPSALKIHMVGHNNKRDVPCEVCGKLYKTIADVKKHAVQHEELKFVCDVQGCTKKFFKSLLLERHKMTHLGQRDFACHLCDKKYFRSKNLNDHISNVHEQLKYICEVPGCSSTHSRRDYYRNHVLTKHRDLPQDTMQQLLKRLREIKPIYIETK